MTGNEAAVRVLRAGRLPSVCVCLSVYRREFLLEHALFQVPGMRHEDLEWVPRVWYFAERTAVLDYSFVNYRKHAGVGYDQPDSAVDSRHRRGARRAFRLLVQSRCVRGAQEGMGFALAVGFLLVLLSSAIYREVSGKRPPGGVFRVFQPPGTSLPRGGRHAPAREASGDAAAAAGVENPAGSSRCAVTSGISIIR